MTARRGNSGVAESSNRNSRTAGGGMEGIEGLFQNGELSTEKRQPTRNVTIMGSYDANLAQHSVRNIV